MLLSQNEAELFFKLHRSLMHFVNQRLGVVSDVDSPEEFASLSPEVRLKVRDAFLDNCELLQTFVEENPARLSKKELDIVFSWRHMVSGQFYAFRQLKNYMVFLSSGEPSVAYGVVALSEPFESVIGSRVPQLFETVLLPFQDKIVYDGLLSGYNIHFGGGIKQTLNNSYREAKERLGIVASLPIESSPTPIAKSTTPRKSKKRASKKSPDVKDVVQIIVQLTDEFCHDHLNDEYAELCRKLVDKLSRKRPSPLLRGKPKSWASGVIRTIGWVNFLDDPATQPHLPFTFIDQVLGVGQSTGQGKSREIRRLLKISTCDTDWTLPSRMDDNPLAWLLEVDGFVLDVRHAPKEIQEIAFQKGLIPYIPAVAEINTAVNVVNAEVAPPNRIFQFKINLNGTVPAIWRRIQVQDCTLDKLHEDIQTAMGWTNSHLHQFEIGGVRYGDPELLDDDFMDCECVDSNITNISEILPHDGTPMRFLYEYDFGDGWEHEVLFEGCPPVEPGLKYPTCVEGQRACPPEDVGGVWGYAEFLEALADPDHEQHDEMLDWSGPFDPDAFDAEQASQQMRQGLPAWH